MSSYPSMTVDGLDTFKDLGLYMEVTENNPPSPKFYTVDVPGGDGNINLTRVLTQDTVYDNREIKLKFTLAQPGQDFEQFKSLLYGMWHGQEKDFSFSFDEPYTYHGWFSFGSQKREGHLRQLELTIDADPYKKKGTKVENFNVSDGFVAHLDSGRKRVQPTFEFSADTIVVFEGERYVIPKGTHTINDVWFKLGTNDITFVLAGLQSHIEHAEMALFTHEQLSRKKNWELYRGLSKFYVEEIEIEGTEDPITGIVTLTATDTEGNTVATTFDLGDLNVTRYGEAIDRIIIRDGMAVVQKWVIVDTDGTKAVLALPESYTVTCPQLYSHDGEIIDVTSDTGANLTYTTGRMNISQTVVRAKHSDYMEGGDYAMTNEQMKAYSHARLTLINQDGKEVISDRQESVWISYDWLDI